MKGPFLALGLLGVSTAVLAQPYPYPHPMPPHEPPAERPSGGIGIGIGISIGKKKPAPPPPQAPSGPPVEMRDQRIVRELSDQLIVMTKAGAGESDDIARAAMGNVIETALLDEAGLAMIVIELAPDDTVAAARARLSGHPGVLWTQPNQQFQMLGNSRPSRFAIHAIPQSQPNVSGRIVMIDAAVDLAHDNLKGAKVFQQFFGISGAPAIHGTAVAALLVGTGTFPGTAQGAELVSLAAFGDPVQGTLLSRTSWLARAMNEASRLRPDVLNLSFGGPYDRLLATMLDTIGKNGVCVAAAAGNGGPASPVMFPASHPASLAITAVDERLRIYPYATQGSRIDLAGVGVGLNAAVPGGRRAVSGTSFATAVISGALLRIPACNGGRNPAAMKSQTAALAKDLGEKGRDPVFGAGLFRLPPAGKK